MPAVDIQRTDPRPHTTVFHAFVGRREVGRIVIITEGHEQYFIPGIEVNEDMRGVGIGTALIEAAQRFCGTDLTQEWLPSGELIVGGKVRTTRILSTGEDFLRNELAAMKARGMDSYERPVGAPVAPSVKGRRPVRSKA